MSEEELVEVRATVNLPGLRAGRKVLVDPTLPWIKAAFENKTLVPVEPIKKSRKRSTD